MGGGPEAGAGGEDDFDFDDAQDQAEHEAAGKKKD